MPDPEISLTCQQVFDNLYKDWRNYPNRFQRLPAEEKAAFLHEQGFANFHDLLAHIVAWWEEAIRIIHSILDLNEIPSREYDIGAFNAAALKRFKNWKEDDLLIHYENIRQALISLTADLPEAGLQNRRINGWLKACLVDHFHEHDLKD